MVFYRKYRPQTIHDLDLDSVREKLTAILMSSLDGTRDVPHAFLFTGPKGLGKTSAARILAKAINCEAKSKVKSQKSKVQVKSKKLEEVNDERQTTNEEIEPCNQCDACVSITNGSNVDVLEIDAASNRGIDEIRDLRDKVKFAPASLRKKVYIIDEVHMLTTEAFNALLKTLEEPPSHVVFILCTTEFWKLPPTIVSRAFHVQFEKPSAEQIIRSFKRLVDGEKLKVEDGVLEKVAELSDGAFRDGAKILEELALSAQNNKITLELLEKVYKSGSIEHDVGQLLIQLSQKDAKGSLETIGKLALNGSDFKVVIEKMVEELRSLLLEQNGLGGSSLSPQSSLKERGSFTVQDLEKLLEYFSEAYKNLKTAVVPQLPLELVVVKWCIIEDQKLDQTGVQNEKSSVQAEDDKRNNSSQNASKIPNTKYKIQDTDSGFLKNLISAIQKDNFSIAGVLRSCSLISITDSEVKIEAPFKFHGDKLRDAKVTALLENIAKGLIGRDIKFIISVKGEN